MERKKKRQYAIAAAKIGISIGLLWYLIRSGRLSLTSLGDVFTPGSLLYAVPSAVIFFGSQAIASFRLAFLLRAVGYPIRMRTSFKLTMISNFFNFVTPGMVGGDVLKGYHLAQQEEGKGRSASIVLMDRVLGLFALSALAGVSILYLINAHRAVFSPYRGKLYVILAAIISAFLLFTAVLSAAAHGKTRQKVKTVIHALFSRGMLFYMAEGFGRLARQRSVMVYSFLWSLVIQVLCICGVLALVPVFHVTVPDFRALMAVSSIVMFAGILPVTPGGIGWTEFVASLGWSAIGSSLGGQVFLSWRIVCMLSTLPWGLYYFFYSHRIGSSDRPQEGGEIK